MKKNLIFKIFVILIIAFNFAYGMRPQSNAIKRDDLQYQINLQKKAKKLAALEAMRKGALEEAKKRGEIDHQTPLEKQIALLSKITLKKEPLTNQDRQQLLAYKKIQRQAAQQENKSIRLVDKLKNYKPLTDKEKQEKASRLKEGERKIIEEERRIIEEKRRIIIEEERVRFSISNNLIQASLALKNLMNYLDRSNIYYTNYATNVSIGSQSVNVVAILKACVQAIKDANKVIKSNNFDTGFKNNLLSLARNIISNIKIFISSYLKEEDQKNALNFILSTFPGLNLKLLSTDLLRRLQSINNSLKNIINADSDVNSSSLGRVKGLIKRTLEAIAIINKGGEAMKEPVLTQELETTLANLNKLNLKELKARDNILRDNNKIEEVMPKSDYCSIEEINPDNLSLKNKNILTSSSTLSSKAKDNNTNNTLQGWRPSKESIICGAIGCVVVGSTIKFLLDYSKDKK